MSKATYSKVVVEAFGVPTAFHLVSQPIERKGELRLTVSCQMPAIKFEDGVLKAYPNPKNKP